MSEQKQIQVPPGYVAVTTWGKIEAQMAFNLLEAVRFNDQNGLTNIKYEQVPSGLVEKARNEACRRCLQGGFGWLLFIDGDSVFAPDAIFKLVQSAYALTPQADVMGAYVPLRGDMALPTIDTGTGTWESHFAGSGTMEVIRTGAAFVLVKRHVLEGMKDPWFRMRVPARPLDFMQEVDGFARQKFDGKNPFRDLPNGEWEKLYQCALEDPSASPENFVPAEVGEDSGFADRARFSGYRIFVDTNISVGHLDQTVRTWVDHKKAIAEMQKNLSYAVGLNA